MKDSIFNEMLFPKAIKCIVCQDELPLQNRFCVCDKCSIVYNNVSCAKCGRAIKDENYLLELKHLINKQSIDLVKKNQILCYECKKYPVDFLKASAPFLYDGNAKLLIKKLKYGNALYLVRYLARFMADKFISLGWNVDFITFVPMPIKREKGRGYNQAEHLAKELSSILNIDCIDVLDNIKYIKNLARLNREQRFKMIRDTIKVIDGVDFNSKTVLLVDDVFTSGATSSECSRQLVNSGAKEVYVLTFATSQGLIKN